VTVATGGRFRSGIRNTPEVFDLRCTIVVLGELDERFDGAFADLALVRQSGTTRLSGALIDQSEL
jgi:hypothetical protein